jgi:hypothetical protein
MGTQSVDISPIAVLRDGPIQTPKDLEGRSLAVLTQTDILGMYSLAYLANKGIDLAKVKIVEIPFPQQYDALLSRWVDAASMTEPFATMAVERGNAKILAYPYTETQPNLTSVVLITMARGLVTIRMRSSALCAHTCAAKPTSISTRKMPQALSSSRPTPRWMLTSWRRSKCRNSYKRLT